MWVDFDLNLNDVANTRSQCRFFGIFLGRDHEHSSKNCYSANNDADNTSNEGGVVARYSGYLSVHVQLLVFGFFILAFGFFIFPIVVLVWWRGVDGVALVVHAVLLLEFGDVKMALDLALVVATLEARLADVLPFVHKSASMLTDLVNGFVAWTFEDAFRIRNCFSTLVAHAFISSVFVIREKGNVFRASLKLALNEIIIFSGDSAKEARGKKEAVHQEKVRCDQ